MGLQFYLQDAKELIADQAGAFTSDAQLTRWINSARRDIARRTGCVRRLITGQSAFGASAQPGYIIPGGMQPGALPNAIPASQNPLSAYYAAQNDLQSIPNVERYPYQGFFNPLLAAQYDGCKGVIDTIAFAVNWGGNFRPQLNWIAWENLQAYCRAYANQTTSYPSVWSVYNDGEFGEIWMFPTPSQAGEIEADCACIPIDLYSDDDFDAIPPEMQEAVKFKAAELSFYKSQRYAQCEKMFELYMNYLGTGSVARDHGKSSSFYSTYFS